MAEYGKSVEAPEEKKLHQKPLGYFLAALGGSLGGPFGWIVSPLVLLACNISGEKVLKDKNGKETTIGIWAQWAVAGVVLAPILSFAYFAGNPSPAPKASSNSPAASLQAGSQVNAGPDRGTQENTTQESTPAQPIGISNSKRNAIRSAESYLRVGGFSREGLIRQLSSRAGSGYSVEDATYAVDSLNIDWNAQAARSAESYLRVMGFSCDGLINQLSSSSGSQYTRSQAEYGARAAGACS